MSHELEEPALRGDGVFPGAHAGRPLFHQQHQRGRSARGATPRLAAAQRAYTCDEARTEISASELVDIIVADPNTTIIFRTAGSGSYERIVLLRPNQIHTDLSEVRLEGTLAGNKTDVIDAYVNKTSNEIRLFVNNA